MIITGEKTGDKEMIERLVRNGHRCMISGQPLAPPLLYWFTTRDGGTDICINATAFDGELQPSLVLAFGFLRDVVDLLEHMKMIDMGRAKHRQGSSNVIDFKPTHPEIPF